MPRHWNLDTGRPRTTLACTGWALGQERSRRRRPGPRKADTGLQARWLERKMRRPSGRIAGPLEVNHANRACRRDEKRALCARLHGRLSGRDIRRRAHLFGANQFLRWCLLRYYRLCRGLLRDGFPPHAFLEFSQTYCLSGISPRVPLATRSVNISYASRLLRRTNLHIHNANEKTLSCSASCSDNACFRWPDMSSVQPERTASRPRECEVGDKDQDVVLLGFRSPSLRRHARAAVVSRTLDSHSYNRRERRSPYQQVL